jgi:hypothetical protein
MTNAQQIAKTRRQNSRRYARSLRERVYGRKEVLSPPKGWRLYHFSESGPAALLVTRRGSRKWVPFTY